MQRQLQSEHRGREQNSAAAFILTPIALCAILLATSPNYLLFHTLAEGFAVLVATCLAVVAWQTYSFSKNDYLVFLGVGYFWVGILDLLHTLAYPGLGIFSFDNANRTAQLWIATRLLEAIGLAVAPVFLARRLRLFASFTFVGAIASVIAACVFAGYFPDAFVPGHGLTPFKIYAEYTVIVLLGGTLLVLTARRRKLDHDVYLLLCASIILTIAAEVAFTLYHHPTGLPNLIGHLFKLLSFWCIFVGVVRTTLQRPFRIMARGMGTYEAIPIPAVVVDDDGTIQRANRAAVELAGQPLDALVGASAHEHFHLGSGPGIECTLCQVSGTRGSTVDILICDRSRTTWYECSTSSLVDVANQPRITVQTFQNVSQRVATETKRRESEERVKLLLNSTAEGIYGVDGEGRCTFANAACVEILGYEQQSDLLGEPMHARVQHTARDGSAQPEVKSRVYATYQHGSGAHCEDEIMWRHDGTSFDAEYWSYPVWRDSDLHGAVVTFVDITSRKEVEAELAGYREHLENLVQARTVELSDARDRALAATRAKSGFLANMSHELRTPLNSILGFSQIVLSGGAGPVSDEQKRQLGIVHRSAEDLLGLINQILDLSRIEAGKMSVDLTEVNLARLLANCHEQFRHGLVDRPVDLELTAEGVSVIESDATKLRQILTNLLSNSLKFTPRGKIAAVIRECDGGVELIVDDTGTGIPENQRARIFEPFETVRESGRHGIAGTGLGLAICRHLAELLGGEINLEDRPGAGTRFRCRIPARIIKSTPAATPESAAVGEAVGEEVILVVDDQPEAVDLVRAYLEPIGYRIVSANSHEQALALAFKIRPFAITLDILMPDVDGWSTLAALKADQRTRDIPVIVISVVDDRKRGLALGAVDFLVKPVSATRLRHSLEAVRPVDRHVLVVDDDPQDAELLREMLASAGYQVRVTHSVTSALDDLKTSTPAVMLVDLVMQGLTGFDLISRVRSDPVLKNVPVVVVSAKILDPEEATYLRKHTAAVVDKLAVNMTVVLAEVARVLREHDRR